MQTIHVLFDSQHGQTMRIAQQIARTLKEHGALVHLSAVADDDLPADLWSADCLVLGGSIHDGYHSGALMAFVERYRRNLDSIPVAFFSVSLCAGGTASDREEAKGYMERFVQELDWQPTVRTIFAGALRYRHYSWVTRCMMKWIAKKRGIDTDTKRNHEYTNWQTVERFAAACWRLANGLDPENQQTETLGYSEGVCAAEPPGNKV